MVGHVSEEIFMHRFCGKMKKNIWEEIHIVWGLLMVTTKILKFTLSKKSEASTYKFEFQSEVEQSKIAASITD